MIDFLNIFHYYSSSKNKKLLVQIQILFFRTDLLYVYKAAFLRNVSNLIYAQILILIHPGVRSINEALYLFLDQSFVFLFFSTYFLLISAEID